MKSGKFYTKKEDEAVRQQWIAILDILFDLARDRGWTTFAEMRRQTGISANTLSKWWHEDFYYMHTNTISRFMAAVNVTPAALHENEIAYPPTVKLHRPKKGAA